ncbi:biopolymer transporter ExbD [Mucilaginibacter sp. UR6-1]|uniref:ExbD/TolR family protein n=1 Tax=Mucilaginibacter sp. UR6-1 TaxID=1435643 RepID=UPI001E322BA7|nr:biopolymer transporter ExbD [Mucilaginibacter sp. UR6-1]MCC8408908.1 biopolymer transporter ExbD [Mucilaginibacter sp. UR6-1]
MAELNTSAAGSGRKATRKRASTRVDLTAMVDLAFLLITFFMLTTTLSKSKMMPIVMPDIPGETGFSVSENRTLTVCLGKDNKALWYLGRAEQPILKPTVAGYGKNGIRKALLDARAYVKNNYGKTLMVIVKPADSSKYENLVNTIDELDITQVPAYAIADIAPQDIELLKQKGMY